MSRVTHTSHTTHTVSSDGSTPTTVSVHRYQVRSPAPAPSSSRGGVLADTASSRPPSRPRPPASTSRYASPPNVGHSSAGDPDYQTVYQVAPGVSYLRPAQGHTYAQPSPWSRSAQPSRPSTRYSQPAQQSTYAQSAAQTYQSTASLEYRSARGHGSWSSRATGQRSTVQPGGSQLIVIDRDTASARPRQGRSQPPSTPPRRIDDDDDDDTVVPGDSISCVGIRQSPPSPPPHFRDTPYYGSQGHVPSRESYSRWR
ncbi:hypothetical protein IAR55_004647 [Kwoniella newhampshirensis]|uniref:Uncharacterized protein n=1 Tax=Kwoniella newhampshirensis TaxID=1651941 RepID=A0AAW0YKB9_9TREE